jgi:hypothetical protein
MMERLPGGFKGENAVSDRGHYPYAHGVAAGLEDVDFCCGGTEAEGRLLVPVQPIQHRGRQGTNDLLDVVEVGHEVSMLDSFVMCDPVAQCSQPIELGVDIVPLDLWCEQALERR